MRRNSGLQKKFMSVLFFTTVAFLLLILLIINLVLYNREIQSYREDASIRMSVLADMINDNFDSMLDKSNNIAQNQFVIDLLREGPKDSMHGIMEDYAFLNKLFGAYTEYGSNASNYIKLYPINENFPAGQYISKLYQLKENPVWDTINNMYVYEAMWCYQTTDRGHSISLYRKISSYNEILGFLEISVPFYHIENALRELDLKNNEQILYITPEESILYQNTETVSEGLTLEEVLISKDTIMLNVSWSSVLRRYFYYCCFSVLVFALIAFGIYALYKCIVAILMKDMQEFVTLLRSDERSLLSLAASNDDGAEDIQFIKNKFKDLILEIQRIYRDLEKSNQEKRKVEMEYLQMSFNPHLLYNTLSALNWSFYQSGTEEMRNLVSELSSYYRAVLSGGSNIITLKEEIELIRQYLRIVEVSYKRKITFELKADEALLDCFVIKQLLQPIVENAVLHGINDQEEVYIQIQILRQDKDIIFKIFNDGRSMSQEEIETVISGEKGKNVKRGYGIFNTISRIKTYYGEKYGLEIIGVPEGGTEVIIRIECLEEDELFLRM
ncbi:MAG: histidine kinase [Clostridia bacterium]|nr:histidine kinase [Clostridia bacterium]